MIISALFIVGIGIISLKALFVAFLTKLFFGGCFAVDKDAKKLSLSWLIFGVNALVVVKIAELL